MAFDLYGSCMGVAGLNRSECASWVQAWGSILALAVALGLAGFDVWRRRREARRAQADALEAALYAIEMATGLVKTAGEELSTSAERALTYAHTMHNPHLYDELTLLMHAVKSESLGTEGMRALVRARTSFASARKAIEGCVEGMLKGTVIPGTSNMAGILSLLARESDAMAHACQAAGRTPKRSVF